MAIRETVPANAPNDLARLSNLAREGAAEVFAANVADSANELEVLFNDPNEEVREIAAEAMQHIDDLEPDLRESLIRSFVASRAFETNARTLIRSLEHLAAELPDPTIEVVERAVELAGTDLADIRTSRAAMSPDLIAVVLRLYRQGGKTLRIRCLDVIDRLAELGAYGLREALSDER